jgi:metal-responsive CopG/Arc/MetJ family transcriptional regulator
MAGSQQVNIRFPDQLLAEVEGWAEREQRDRSQMIRVLLGEALAERKRIDSERSPR